MSDVIVSSLTNNDDMLLNTYEKCLMCLFSLLLFHFAGGKLTHPRLTRFE